MRVLLQSIDVFAQLLDLLLHLLHGVQFVLDGHHVALHLDKQRILFLVVHINKYSEFLDKI